MAVHSHAMAAILSQKQDVYGTGSIERPDMNPLSVDLRLNDTELILAGLLGNMDAARPQVGSRNSLPPRWFVLLDISVRLESSLRPRHGALHITRYVRQACAAGSNPSFDISWILEIHLIYHKILCRTQR